MASISFSEMTKPATISSLRALPFLILFLSSAQISKSSLATAFERPALKDASLASNKDSESAFEVDGFDVAAFAAIIGFCLRGERVLAPSIVGGGGGGAAILIGDGSTVQPVELPLG